jgi:hypothetical protein
LKRNNAGIRFAFSSRRGILTAAFLSALAFLILAACSSGGGGDSLEIRQDRSAEEGFRLLVRWEGIADVAAGVGAGGDLERLVEYRVVIRTEGLLAGRLNMRFQRELTYDPFTQSFILNDIWTGNPRLAGSSQEFLRLAAEPAVLPLPEEELLNLGDREFDVAVEAYLRRVSEDSAFRRWLILYGNYQFEASGETRIVLTGEPE